MSTTSRFSLRMRLSTILGMIAVVALALGWYSDHRRMAERLSRAEMQNEIYRRQLPELRKYGRQFRGSGNSAGGFYGGQPHYYWANADEFLQALTSTPSRNDFLEMAPSLGRADIDVFHRGVERTIDLVDDSREENRVRAVITLRFLQESAKERMEPHAEAVVKALIPAIEDDSSTVVGETLAALGAYGPVAQPALNKLRRMMNDDSDPAAVSAALAIAKIDPSFDITSRLIELIEMRHPSWQTAAFYLPRHAKPERAREVLTNLYATAESEASRNAAIQALNNLELEIGKQSD